MGKGYGSTTIPVQAGIIYDLNTLYKKFRAKNSVRLTDFTEVFREMGMNEIWKGRQSAAELVEFSEKLLQICATYMCSYRQSEASGAGELIHHTLEERVFGVYCSYAFYFLQPVDYVTSIRIPADDLVDFADFFQNRLVPARHLDTACCLFKLLDAGAFRVVPFKNCYDPAFHRRYDVPDCEEIITEISEEPFQLATDIANDPILKQIGIIQEKYDKMKLNHLANARAGKNLCEALNDLVGKEKLTFIDEKIRSKNLVVEDIEAVNAAVHQLETGESLFSGRSSKSILKNRAYKSNIRYNRNRRYADPNALDDGDDDINEQNIFKDVKRVRTTLPEDEIEEAAPNSGNDDSAGERLTLAELAIGVKEEGRRPTTSAEKRKSTAELPATKRKRREKKVDEGPLTLSKQEGRSKRAQKRAEVAEEEAFYAAGLLPPVKPKKDKIIVNRTPSLEKPTVSSTKKTVTIASTSSAPIDPEISELLKAYQSTADEEKQLEMVGKLINEASEKSPAKKKTRAPRGKAAQKKKGQDKDAVSTESVATEQTVTEAAVTEPVVAESVVTEPEI